MFKRLVGLAVLCLALMPDAGMAEEWVRVSQGRDGATYEVEIGSPTLTHRTAHGRVRAVEKRNQKSPRGQSYVQSLIEVTFDCAQALVRYDSQTFADHRGNVVDKTTSTRWDKFDKGTVEEEIATAICMIASADTTKDIRDGKWRALGQNSDGTLFYAYDDIQDLGDDRVFVTVRGDFREYQVSAGLPYRHIIDKYAISCRDRTFVDLSWTYYLTPTKAIFVADKEEKDLKVERVNSKSIFNVEFGNICAAPRIAVKADGKPGANRDGLSTGTAWATNKGYLVTASHVIDGGKKIAVYQNSQKIGEAVVVSNDPANDVAVLKYVPAGGAKIRIIPLADKPGALGKSVFTLGFPAPDVMGQAVKMSAGDISATSGLQDDARFMQISIPIQEGNSGGPVIGFDGSAVGVVSAKLTRFSEEKDALKPENVNYAVKIAYLRPLLEELPDLKDWTPIKVSGGSPEDLIAQAREAVFMLVVTP
jgi:S1-C subfamily serine protease